MKTKTFLKDTGASIPVVCGPMYPGSNPELIAAVSEAGGFGVVQPLSLTSLYGHDFREGLKFIKKLTKKPFGVNFTIFGGANQKYHDQMKKWMDISIEEGVKFFLTSLGKPNDASYAIIILAAVPSIVSFLKNRINLNLSS